jgi:hypothetical protein
MQARYSNYVTAAMSRESTFYAVNLNALGSFTIVERLSPERNDSILCCRLPESSVTIIIAVMYRYVAYCENHFELFTGVRPLGTDYDVE